MHWRIVFLLILFLTEMLFTQHIVIVLFLCTSLRNISDKEICDIELKDDSDIF